MKNSDSIDRSGLEIFSILSSKIKRFQYYGDDFSFDATRRSENSKTFNIKTVNKKTKVRVNFSKSGNKLKILLKPFLTIRALKKITVDSDSSVHDLGVIKIEDYSVLEPAEFNFVLRDNLVILKLSKHECYIVDIQKSAFWKLRGFLKDDKRGGSAQKEEGS